MEGCREGREGEGRGEGGRYGERGEGQKESERERASRVWVKIQDQP